jgi:hypothetical protein
MEGIKEDDDEEMSWASLGKACLDDYKELLPESCDKWWKSPNVLETFPTSNGHNKIFYGYKTLFDPEIQAFINMKTGMLTDLLPVLDSQAQLPGGLQVVFT